MPGGDGGKVDEGGIGGERGDFLMETNKFIIILYDNGEWNLGVSKDCNPLLIVHCGNVLISRGRIFTIASPCYWAFMYDSVPCPCATIERREFLRMGRTKRAAKNRCGDDAQ